MNPTDPSNDTRGLGRGMLIVFWILALGLLTWGFGLWEKQLFNPNQSPVIADSSQYRQVILESNRQHHYVASGTINGRPVTFLLDTGATDVVIPAQLADRLKLRRGLAARAATANGFVTVYSTHLDSVSLGSIELNDIDASINPGMGGDGVLLGMSALRNIEFSQKDGQLILRQAESAR